MDDDAAGEDVYNCARFILNKGCGKAPIKRADIVKYLQTLPGETSSARVNAIIKNAAKLLSDIYGYRLQQVSSKSGVNFILILDEDSSERPHDVSETSKHHALLMATLTHIFMSGSSVNEDDMWRFLERANLMKNEDHERRKILTSTFTKELYLKYEKVGEADYANFVFKWGERALLELPQKYLLKKVTEAFDRPLEYWHEQYQAAEISDMEISKLLNES